MPAQIRLFYWLLPKMKCSAAFILLRSAIKGDPDAPAKRDFGASGKTAFLTGCIYWTFGRARKFLEKAFKIM